MKKFLIMLLCLSLMILPCTAFASQAQYSSTRSFLALLDQNNIVYEYNGIDSDGDEVVLVENNGEDVSYTIRYFFDDGQENASLRVWYLMDYSDADFSRLTEVCNSIHNSYKYVTFYCDTSDNTITAGMDLIFRSHDVDEIVWEATLFMVNVIDAAYPQLAPYAR